MDIRILKTTSEEPVVAPTEPAPIEEQSTLEEEYPYISPCFRTNPNAPSNPETLPEFPEIIP